MSLNAIKTITEAEENSRSAKAEAQAEVKRMVEQAETAGREAVAAALLSAEEDNLNMLREIDLKSEEYSAELKSHTDNRRAVMRAHAEARFGEAAQIIVERIVSG
jgi:vacuolar-type H+-ATPase subunit H